jgi:hypothetical protein
MPNAHLQKALDDSSSCRHVALPKYYKIIGRTPASIMRTVPFSGAPF